MKQELEPEEHANLLAYRLLGDDGCAIEGFRHGALPVGVGMCPTAV